MVRYDHIHVVMWFNRGQMWLTSRFSKLSYFKPLKIMIFLHNSSGIHSSKVKMFWNKIKTLTKNGSVAVNESTAVKGVVEMVNQLTEINFMVRYISWMNLFIAKIQQTIMVIHSLNLFPKNMLMSVPTICFNIFSTVYDSYCMSHTTSNFLHIDESSWEFFISRKSGTIPF